MAMSMHCSLSFAAVLGALGGLNDTTSVGSFEPPLMVVVGVPPVGLEEQWRFIVDMVSEEECNNDGDCLSSSSTSICSSSYSELVN